ncbi:hypothetical protein AM587_10004464 [Phytophthora nicotianae]|uniref:Uncharacterized protein n=1 Tax=Phytophthora nicotianae TaxID=4792 RepID=A0A0W8CSF1_PHYNI|nr:hypothetical protein AM587_10004464 [Phytophthora nicotianae]
MGSISAKTLAAYVTKLHEHVQGRVRAELPDKFALVMDGRTSARRHCVAIFAVVDDTSVSGPTPVTGEDYFDDLDCLSRRFLLLAFLLVDEEEDLSAQSLFDLIADTLSVYERPWDAVLWVTGDNCSVNQYIGRREGAIPFIGCASHRFNLVMKDMLAPEETVLSQVHSLMKALSKLKYRAKKKRISALSRGTIRAGQVPMKWSIVTAG